jgi:stage V sporulation protein D (sporulation-specific penicillin-binding protein)
MVSVRRRIAWLFMLFVSVFAVLGVRLLYLEVIRNQYFLAMALDQRMRPIPLLASRGDILDRNQNKLAVSMSTDAIYATPVEIQDVEQVVAQLTPLLGLEPEWLRERLTRKQAMVWLKLKVDPETARQVIELGIPGVGVTDRPQRFYPHGNLAAQVLGFAGMDNQGLEGLEAYYDRYLRGNPGMIIRERDARGRAIPGGTERRLAPQDGYDLVLTLDQVVQYVAERQLQKAVIETESELGIAVFVRPQTGEILACAVYPTFDPNDYASVPAETWRNRAFTDQYEPGSIFKVITGASALEANVTRLDEVFVDPIRLVRWGGAVSCWRSQGHGSQTLVEATENSCNPVFAILAADRLGPKSFYRYASAFGFGARSGVDFPGEAKGLLPRPGETKHGELLQWANIGFGQGVAVSPIQMAMAVAAMANGGRLMRPHLAKEIRDKSGKLVKTFEPQLVRRVLSEQTARDFATVMRSVVVNGSGSRADVPGFRVAGKTGTAEMPSPRGGYSNDRIASFAGFAPVDDPQIAGVVMLVKIGVRPAYGGTWAAPVFASVVEKALEYMGVERRADPGSLQTAAPDKTFVPNVQSLALADATRMLTAVGLRTATDGPNEGYVELQMPRPGAEVKRGSSVHLSLYPESDRAEEVRIPNAVGRTLRDVSVLLGQAGLRLRIEGVGEQAYAQEPEAGSYARKGDVVTVRFR